MRTIFFLALLFFVAVPCAALEESSYEKKKEEEVTILPSTELQKRLETTEKEISDLRVQRDYLRTESPEVSSDSFEIERTGFGSAGAVKSNLLNPRAEYETERRLGQLYETKEEIEKELNKRDDYNEGR